MPPAVRPLATGRAIGSLALLVSLCALTVGCTRTTDLAADVEVEQSTTTLRIPVRHVPRATTTTTAAPSDTPPDAAPQPAAPATAAEAAAPVTNSGFLALAAAVQRAGAAGAITTTTQPAPAAPPTVPPPATTTTNLPALNPHILASAQNVTAAPGDAQVFQVLVDIAPVGPVTCTGRDYVLAASGWVAASFSAPVDCPTDSAPSLRRTLPVTAPSGQYAFCTEIDPSSPTTVCALYAIRQA